MDADQQAIFDAEHTHEMIEDVKELARDAGGLSGPMRLKRLRGLLQNLQEHFAAIDNSRR